LDTIFALASARGKAGVSVIRVSGDRAGSIAGELAGITEFPLKPTLRSLRSRDGVLIDRALVLGFEAGASFTSEQTIEFQVHGSPAIVRRVLSELGRFEGTRQAEPGEFTRRAMENGALNLAQVEGLADLIEAETESQRKQAMHVFEGHLGELAQGWRTDLVRAMALLQATIDFADEDVPEDVVPEVQNLIDGVITQLEGQMDGYKYAERVRDGFRVAIVGPPNVGKSTLLNAIVGRDVAITSDIAGTTRDIIEKYIDIKGLAVTFFDTAGLRVSDDELESIGIERAEKIAKSADLRIFLGTCDDDFDVGVASDKDDLVVWAKSDQNSYSDDVLSLSAKTGTGVSKLMDLVSDRLSTKAESASSLIRERHQTAVKNALDDLKALSLDNEIEFLPIDLYAEHLRSAVDNLGSIIGLVGVEDVLDEVFSSFCLGK